MSGRPTQVQPHVQPSMPLYPSVFLGFLIYVQPVQPYLIFGIENGDHILERYSLFFCARNTLKWLDKADIHE
jgi:hypothetical protein